MNRDKENGVHVRVLAPAPTTRRKNRRKNKPKMTVREQELANRVITSVHRGLKKTRVIKYYDFILLNQTCSSTVGFANLTQIPQGPGQSQRIADTIWIQKIDVRFYAYEMESTTDYTNYLRISLLLGRRIRRVWPLRLFRFIRMQPLFRYFHPLLSRQGRCTLYTEIGQSTSVVTLAYRQMVLNTR